MWILIIFAHVGMPGSGNSNALTNVPGFQSEKACEVAGNKAKKMAQGNVKEITFVCVNSN